MHFGVLGPLRVWTTDGTPVEIPEVKVRALLACLLVYEGRVVSVDRLTEVLWADQIPAKPTSSLQRKVWQLRRVLDQAEPGARDLLVSRPPGYLLSLDGEATDAARFQNLTAGAREAHTARESSELLAEALALWRGPAFADFKDEEFTRAATTHLDEEWLSAIEDHATARLSLGELGALVGRLDELVRQHPLRERLRAVYMQALYTAGRQSEALESYTELRERLVEELGIDPGPELAGLHQAILRQDPKLDTEPAAEAAKRQTNLPAALTGLVGRAEATSHVQELLGEQRLVTLIGSGGVGKTQLAMTAANGLVDTFPDGVWAVEFAHRQRATDVAATGSAGVTEELAAALGIRDDRAPGRLSVGEPVALIDHLAGVLRTRQMLLLLDGCEHVIARVAETADHLLRAASGLRILATSQEPLGIPGEVVWAVPPLELPDTTSNPDPTTLGSSSAVRLFVTRAAAAKPGFTLGPNNAWAVATLCRRLDGLPLALELAASRVRALGVDGLVERIDDRFRLLASGHRGAPPRQQTLRAMIDWSWELLSVAERAVLRRMAVHAEGCTLDAAEAVCAGEEAPPADIAALLARLVDRSMVIAVPPDGEDQRDHDEPATAATQHRYRLLESVQDYCLERLRAAGELESVCRQHSRYYAALAERADPKLRGAEQHAWLRHLDQEAANLRRSFETTIQQQEADDTLRIANALAWYWVLRGRLTEGRRNFDAALSAAGETPSALRAGALGWRAGFTALLGEGTGWASDAQAASELHEELGDAAGWARTAWFLGFALFGSGDQAVSEKLVDEALVSFQALDDQWGIAAARTARATHALGRGDLATLRQDGEQGRALFRDLGDRWGELHAAQALSSLAEIGGDYERATRLICDGLRIAEELRLDSYVSHQLARLGRIFLLHRDYAQAKELHERARRLAIQGDDKPGEHYAALGLALGARRQGELAEAEAHLHTWLDWSEQVQWTPGTAFILAELGFIAELRGNAATARAWHLRGLAAARDSADLRAIALALEGVAGSYALAGYPALATRLLAAASTARDSVDAPLPETERGDVDRVGTAARNALSETEFATEFQRGVDQSEWYLNRAVPVGKEKLLSEPFLDTGETHS